MKKILKLKTLDYIPDKPIKVPSIGDGGTIHSATEIDGRLWCKASNIAEIVRIYQIDGFVLDRNSAIEYLAKLIGSKNLAKEYLAVLPDLTEKP